VRPRPKVFQVLVYLLTQRERVIIKQELSAQGRRGRFISDATLESTLAAVRRALRDRGRAHRYIHTLHGHGYRFVAPVEECTDRLPSAAGDTRFPASEAISAASRDSPQTAAGPAPAAAVGEHAAGSLLAGPADGAPTSQGTPPLDHEPSPDAGERKLVSVLCCGLSLTVGSGALADLDSLHRQVRELYDLVRREVRRYGGTVQLVVGERVLAVVGLPAAQEDHAQRAVLAALGLQSRLQQPPTATSGRPTPWPSAHMGCIQALWRWVA
jgi:DNA-binding winged helix-turn-helix (wHTH) protein